MNAAENESNLVFYLKVKDQGPNQLRTLLNLSRLIYGHIPTYHYFSTNIDQSEFQFSNESLLNETLQALELSTEINFDQLPLNKKYLSQWIMKTSEERQLLLINCPAEILSKEEIQWFKDEILKHKIKSKIIFCGNLPEIWADLIDQYVEQNEDFTFHFKNNPFTHSIEIKAA